jgi:hypothetical protein
MSENTTSDIPAPAPEATEYELKYSCEINSSDHDDLKSDCYFNNIIEPNANNEENYCKYEMDALSTLLNDFKNIVKCIKKEDNREYIVYTNQHETLELVRFKIGAHEFISVNANVMKLEDFLNISYMENIVNSDNKIKELRSYDKYQVRIHLGNREIILYNCSVKLLICALSEINLP